MSEMRVLIPLDGSPLSEIALGALDALTIVSPLSVQLISVIESVEGLTENAHNEMQVRESNLLHSYVEQTTARLAAKPGVVRIEGHVFSGDPVDMIVGQVAEFNPDVLVVATHGRSGFSRWRMGSVADALVRNSVANCLVVGPQAHMHAVVRSVLAPLDGSTTSEKALVKATEFAKALGATLHLVRVVDLPVGAAEEYQNAFEDLRGYWNDYLQSFREKIDPSVDVTTAVRFGSPADRLLDYAASHSVDLIVMSSKGRGGVARSALGSVAGRLIGGPAPVFIVKS